MIDDLEAFIAEHRAKVSQDKQERKTEPRASTHQEPGRRTWSIPSNDQFNFSPASRSGNKENYHLKPSTPEAGIVNKLGGYAEKRQKLKEERRDEYNRFLAGQNFRRDGPNNSSAGPPQYDSFGASIAGLQNRPSSELRKMAERNHEYNEMLHNQRNLHNTPSSNRKGYESPVISYEEILRKKRNEENSYRRHNDPEYYDPRPKAADAKNQFSASEGNLSRRAQQQDPRFTPQPSEPKKVKFGGNSQLPTEAVNFSNNVRSRHQDPDTGHYNSTLLIGERLNDDPQKKESYRRELLRQMAETKELRDREKFESKQAQDDGIFSKRNQDRRPTSWPSGEVTSGRPAGARAVTGHGPGPGPGPGANQMPAVPQSYLGQQKPQFEGNMPRGSYKVDGILANGFEFDLSQPNYRHPLSAPSGIPTQNGPSLMPHNSHIDDAYFYYANQNPLDPNLAAGPSSAAPPLVATSSMLHQPQYEVEPRSTYSRHNVSVERAPPGTFGFSSENDRKQAADGKKRLYQLELQKQMAEDKLRKVTDKQAKERYERRLEEEIANYNPFGRGGGGAPVKDAYGNIVTSRNLGSLAQHEPRQVGFDSQRTTTARSEPVPSTSDLYRSPFKEAEKSADNFARGGNGIFGVPMTQEQKNSKLKYQEELRLQMEEQKMRKEKEKEKMKREDELLEQKIREDELKAAKELEEAARKEKEKQEQLKQDQVAVKLRTEERKRLEEQKKKDEEEAEKERFRQEEEKQRQQKELPRPRSPPIHSALTSVRRNNQDPTGSPPIPAKRTQSRQSQISHSYALEELANLRKNQQMELRDFENDAKQNEPEVYDPRIVLRPQNMKQNYIDVFELAKSGRPASVRRGPSVKDLNNKQKSNHRNAGLSDGLAEPFSDSDADAFEKSQRATIMAQMRDLEKLNKENSNRLRHDSELSAAERPSSNLLRSTTDYVALPIHELNSDAQFLPNKVDHRRRKPYKQMDIPNVFERNVPLKRMNSVTSLDPEELGRKNDERLRKLKSLAGDDLSTDDPDDVVEKFMMRQTGRRPPSGDTLNDNSWMMPSNGH